jgi:hypothetical protein
LNWVEVLPRTGPGAWQSSTAARGALPPGATATVPGGMRSVARSHSGSRSKARALWPREEAIASGPVRGEGPRPICKCDGQPSEATAAVRGGTRSEASSHSSSRSKATGGKHLTVCTVWSELSSCLNFAGTCVTVRTFGLWSPFYVPLALSSLLLPH